MSSESARIKISVGQIVVEYEGQVSFLQNGFSEVLKQTLDLVSRGKAQSIIPNGLDANVSLSALHGEDTMSTNTIASHLGGATGPDVALAAAAHLSLIRGKDKFTRSELLEEMKGATTFYRDSMSGNLSKMLNVLTKNKQLNMISKDIYSLGATERKRMEQSLANRS